MTMANLAPLAVCLLGAVGACEGTSRTGGATDAGPSSSASGSGGRSNPSGAGGAPNACGLDAGTTACGTCVGAACCDPVTACLASPVCMTAYEDFLACVIQPGKDPAGCFSAFIRKQEVDGGLGDGAGDLVGCIITGCRSACGQFTL